MAREMSLAVLSMRFCDCSDREGGMQEGYLHRHRLNLHLYMLHATDLLSNHAV